MSSYVSESNPSDTGGFLPSSAFFARKLGNLDTYSPRRCIADDGRTLHDERALRTIASPIDGGVSALPKRALLCDLEHDGPRPAVVRLQIKSIRARKAGHPMVRETAVCAAHARQLRNLGLAFVSA